MALLYYPPVPATTYLHVPYPWRAAIGRGSSAPADFYLYLLTHAQRNRLPASRSPRALHKLSARREFDLTFTSRALRLLPGKPRPDLDRVVAEVRNGWSELLRRASETGARVAGDPADLSLLALERRSATTLFLFAGASKPALVLKLARPGHPGVAREIEALERAAPLAIAPRFLGWVGEAAAQEGLGGSILSLQKVGDPGAFTAPVEHRDLARRLREMATATLARSVSPEISTPPLDDVLDSGLVGPNVRARVRSSLDTLAKVEGAVLKHTDTSPMNCMVEDGKLVGLVDWEISTTEGAPTFDALNAALSYFEHCFALSRWSRAELVPAFAVAWNSSPFFRFWREDVAASCRELGLPDPSEFEVLFFARRIGHRLSRPDYFPYGPDTAADMLETVCGSS
jgi:hypothetical protein